MSRHNSRRLTALNLLTILLLLCSLPLPASVAARAPASAVPLPVGGESSLPAANGPSAALALEAHALEPPALPVALELSLAAPILHPDESTELALAVTSESAEPLEELWLTLKLPPGVTATPDANGRQALPTLTSGARQVVTFTLTADRVRAPQADTVDTVNATVGAHRFGSRTVAQPLGLSSGSPGDSDAGDPNRPQTAVMGETGALLEDDTGNLALLVATAAVTPTTTFTYTALYRWDRPDPPPSPRLDVTSDLTESLTVTQTDLLTDSAALPYRLYLPAVTRDGAVDGSSQVEQVEDVSSQVEIAARPDPSWQALRAHAREDNGVYFVHLWQLDATHEEQAVHNFAEPVALTLRLNRLRKQGIDPSLLTLWTRPGPGVRWQPVPTHFDPEHKTLTAWLSHFSQFGLGAGLTPSGDLLPNVKAFTVDQLNGGASVQIAVDAPQGLGGLRPAIGFSYSSIALDDLRRAAGDHEMLAQASSVGIGWHLDGVSYIARTDNQLDDDTPDTSKEFALVLNGTRVGIQFQDGKWRTNPEIFAQITWDSSRSGDAHDFGGWTVVLPDGVRYQFGASGSFPSAFDPASATATSLERTNGGLTYRTAKRWYLRKVTDPLGQHHGVSLPGRDGMGVGLRRGQLGASVKNIGTPAPSIRARSCGAATPARVSPPSCACFSPTAPVGKTTRCAGGPPATAFRPSSV